MQINNISWIPDVFQSNGNAGLGIREISVYKKKVFNVKIIITLLDRVFVLCFSGFDSNPFKKNQIRDFVGIFLDILGFSVFSSFVSFLSKI